MYCVSADNDTIQYWISSRNPLLKERIWQEKKVNVWYYSIAGEVEGERNKREDGGAPENASTISRRG